MEAPTRMGSRDRAAAAPERNLQGRSVRMCGAGRRAYSRLGGGMGENESNGESAHGSTGMAQVQQRRVFYQSSPPPESFGPPTDGIVLCSGVSRGRPQLRVEIKPPRVADEGTGLPSLAAVAQDLGYGAMSGGGPPGPPPVPPLEKLPGPPNSKKLKGRARIKSMVKSSTWDWKGSSLDPEFRRPRISLKRKREESESSDSSAKTASQEGSDQEDLFPEKAQSRHIARKCPGLLARYAIKEARKRLLMEMGEDSSSQKPVPVFVRYFRQVFNHSGASAPMKREYLTLAHCLDSILEGNVLKLLDIAVQRLKAVEQISQGVSPATANRLELIPAEMFSLASAEEKRTEAQEQMREMKTSWNLNSWNPSSWNPKGKGWGKPQVEDSGAKGDKNSKGGKAKDQKGKPGGKWRPPKGVPALSSEVVPVKD